MGDKFKIAGSNTGDYWQIVNGKRQYFKKDGTPMEESVFLQNNNAQIAKDGSMRKKEKVNQDGLVKHYVKDSKSGRYFTVDENGKKRFYAADGTELNEAYFRQKEEAAIKAERAKKSGKTSAKAQPQKEEMGLLEGMWESTKGAVKGAGKFIKESFTDEQGNLSIKGGAKKIWKATKNVFRDETGKVSLRGAWQAAKSAGKGIRDAGADMLKGMFCNKDGSCDFWSVTKGVGELALFGVAIYFGAPILAAVAGVSAVTAGAIIGLTIAAPLIIEGVNQMFEGGNKIMDTAYETDLVKAGQMAKDGVQTQSKGVTNFVIGETMRRGIGKQGYNVVRSYEANLARTSAIKVNNTKIGGQVRSNIGNKISTRTRAVAQTYADGVKSVVQAPKKINEARKQQKAGKKQRKDYQKEINDPNVTPERLQEILDETIKDENMTPKQKAKVYKDIAKKADGIEGLEDLASSARDNIHTPEYTRLETEIGNSGNNYSRWSIPLPRKWGDVFHPSQWRRAKSQKRVRTEVNQNEVKNINERIDKAKRDGKITENQAEELRAKLREEQENTKRYAEVKKQITDSENPLELDENFEKKLKEIKNSKQRDELMKDIEKSGLSREEKLIALKSILDGCKTEADILDFNFRVRTKKMGLKPKDEMMLQRFAYQKLQNINPEKYSKINGLAQKVRDDAKALKESAEKATERKEKKHWWSRKKELTDTQKANADWAKQRAEEIYNATEILAKSEKYEDFSEIIQKGKGLKNLDKDINRACEEQKITEAQRDSLLKDLEQKKEYNKLAQEIEKTKDVEKTRTAISDAGAEGKITGEQCNELYEKLNERTNKLKEKAQKAKFKDLNKEVKKTNDFNATRQKVEEAYRNKEISEEQYKKLKEKLDKHEDVEVNKGVNDETPAQDVVNEGAEHTAETSGDSLVDKINNMSKTPKVAEYRAMMENCETIEQLNALRNKLDAHDSLPRWRKGRGANAKERNALWFELNMKEAEIRSGMRFSDIVTDNYAGRSVSYNGKTYAIKDGKLYELKSDGTLGKETGVITENSETRQVIINDGPVQTEVFMNDRTDFAIEETTYPPIGSSEPTIVKYSRDGVPKYTEEVQSNFDGTSSGTIMLEDDYFFKKGNVIEYVKDADGNFVEVKGNGTPIKVVDGRFEIGDTSFGKPEAGERLFNTKRVERAEAETNKGVKEAEEVAPQIEDETNKGATDEAPVQESPVIEGVEEGFAELSKKVEQARNTETMRQDIENARANDRITQDEYDNLMQKLSEREKQLEEWDTSDISKLNEQLDSYLEELKNKDNISEDTYTQLKNDINELDIDFLEKTRLLNKIELAKADKISFGTEAKASITTDEAIDNFLKETEKTEAELRKDTYFDENNELYSRRPESEEVIGAEEIKAPKAEEVAPKADDAVAKVEDDVEAKAVNDVVADAESSLRGASDEAIQTESKPYDTQNITNEEFRTEVETKPLDMTEIETTEVKVSETNVISNSGDAVPESITVDGKTYKLDDKYHNTRYITEDGSFIDLKVNPDNTVSLEVTQISGATKRAGGEILPDKTIKLGKDNAIESVETYQTVFSDDINHTYTTRTWTRNAKGEVTGIDKVTYDAKTDKPVSVINETPDGKVMRRFAEDGETVIEKVETNAQGNVTEHYTAGEDVITRDNYLYEEDGVTIESQSRTTEWNVTTPDVGIGVGKVTYKTVNGKTQSVDIKFYNDNPSVVEYRAMMEKCLDEPALDALADAVKRNNNGAIETRNPWSARNKLLKEIEAKKQQLNNVEAKGETPVLMAQDPVAEGIARIGRFSSKEDVQALMDKCKTPYEYMDIRNKLSALKKDTLKRLSDSDINALCLESKIRGQECFCGFKRVFNDNGNVVKIEANGKTFELKDGKYVADDNSTFELNVDISKIYDSHGRITNKYFDTSKVEYTYSGNNLTQIKTGNFEQNFRYSDNVRTGGTVRYTGYNGGFKAGDVIEFTLKEDGTFKTVKINGQDIPVSDDGTFILDTENSYYKTRKYEVSDEGVYALKPNETTETTTVKRPEQRINNEVNEKPAKPTAEGTSQIENGKLKVENEAPAQPAQPKTQTKTVEVEVTEVGQAVPDATGVKPAQPTAKSAQSTSQMEVRTTNINGQNISYEVTGDGYVVSINGIPLDIQCKTNLIECNGKWYTIEDGKVIDVNDYFSLDFTPKKELKVRYPEKEVGQTVPEATKAEPAQPATKPARQYNMEDTIVCEYRVGEHDIFNTSKCDHYDYRNYKEDTEYTFKGEKRTIIVENAIGSKRSKVTDGYRNGDVIAVDVKGEVSAAKRKAIHKAMQDAVTDADMKALPKKVQDIMNDNSTTTKQIKVGDEVVDYVVDSDGCLVSVGKANLQGRNDNFTFTMYGDEYVFSDGTIRFSKKGTPKTEPQPGAEVGQAVPDATEVKTAQPTAKPAQVNPEVKVTDPTKLTPEQIKAKIEEKFDTEALTQKDYEFTFEKDEFGDLKSFELNGERFELQEDGTFLCKESGKVAKNVSDKTVRIFKDSNAMAEEKPSYTILESKDGTFGIEAEYQYGDNSYAKFGHATLNNFEFTENGIKYRQYENIYGKVYEVESNGVKTTYYTDGTIWERSSTYKIGTKNTDTGIILEVNDGSYNGYGKGAKIKFDRDADGNFNKATVRTADGTKIEVNVDSDGTFLNPDGTKSNLKVDKYGRLSESKPTETEFKKAEPVEAGQAEPATIEVKPAQPEVKPATEVTDPESLTPEQIKAKPDDVVESAEIADEAPVSTTETGFENAEPAPNQGEHIVGEVEIPVFKDDTPIIDSTPTDPVQDNTFGQSLGRYRRGVFGTAGFIGAANIWDNVFNSENKKSAAWTAEEEEEENPNINEEDEGWNPSVKEDDSKIPEAKPDNDVYIDPTAEDESGDDTTTQVSEDDINNATPEELDDLKTRVQNDNTISKEDKDRLLQLIEDRKAEKPEDKTQVSEDDINKATPEELDDLKTRVQNDNTISKEDKDRLLQLIEDRKAENPEDKNQVSEDDINNAKLEELDDLRTRIENDKTISKEDNARLLKLIEDRKAEKPADKGTQVTEPLVKEQTVNGQDVVVRRDNNGRHTVTINNRPVQTNHDGTVTIGEEEHKINNDGTLEKVTEEKSDKLQKQDNSENVSREFDKSTYKTRIQGKRENNKKQEIRHEQVVGFTIAIQKAGTQKDLDNILADIFTFKMFKGRKQLRTAIRAKRKAIEHVNDDNYANKKNDKVNKKTARAIERFDKSFFGIRLGKKEKVEEPKENTKPTENSQNIDPKKFDLIDDDWGIA